MKDDGTVVIFAETVNLADLRGAIRPRVRGVRIEDMQAAVHSAVKARARRKTRK